MVRNAIHREQQRKHRFGHVRPVIHADFKGHKFVAIGNKLVHSEQWKSFIGFLREYGISTLGRQWLVGNLKRKSDRQHEAVGWLRRMDLFLSKQHPQENGLIYYIPSGPTKAFLLLAYDLYALDHNSILQERLVERLRKPDQFWGARHELFAAATFIRANFNIDFSDETDRSQTHPEFIATHKISGLRIAVEAKCRHQLMAKHQSQANAKKPLPRDRTSRLLSRALKKEVHQPYVVFIELALGPLRSALTDTEHFQRLLRVFDRYDARKGARPDEFNVIIFTNHPEHLGHDDLPAPHSDWVFVASQRETRYTLPNDVAMAIKRAVEQYGDIPVEFDDGA